MSTVEKDKNWVTSSFMVTGDQLQDFDIANRFFTTASMKFNDTTPGGSFAINPPPQFTRAADPKADSLFYRGKEETEVIDSYNIRPDSRLGRYYSEAIDDNSQLISMRFGVPKFNSLITFFTSFYNSGAGRLARTGRMSSALYEVGRVAGIAMQIYAPPLLYIHVANFAGDAIRFMMGKPSSKFYYLKPTMPLYWNAVTTIVNHMAVLKGIAPRVGDSANGLDAKLDSQYKLGQSVEDRKQYAAMFPDLFDGNGSINVYALATRAQRKYRDFRKRVESQLDRRFDGLSDTAAFIKSFAVAPLTDRSRNKNFTLQEYITRWMDNAEGKPSTTGSATDDGSKVTEAVEKIPDYSESQKPEDGFWKFFEGELDDGSAFVTFRVNSTGTVSESFSNTVGESEISSKLNGMSSSARSTSFNMANGNIAGILDGVIQGAKDVVSGISDQLGVSGLVALAGGAFVDIPKHWQASAAQLPRSTYTIHLASPYGNRMSRFINIDIQLAMLLAAVLPLSTGKQSYTSPFLCEIYDQGRCQTRLGMIDSLSITRGGGNMGFDNQGQCMSVEVSFSVVDMSSIMHMPIIEGFTLNPSVALFDEDTTFSDYMASLAGLSLADQIYPWRKLKLNFSRAVANWQTFFSKAHAANYLGGTTPALLLSGLYKGIPR